MFLALEEFLGVALRFLHVVAGIAWIGSSFYFIALDLSLKPRDGLPAGVKGEAWQVHGGGFYHMVKYLVAPARMPDELTWFKWEAYTTWLSGFALLIVVYYWNARLFLVDADRGNLSETTAIALSLTGLVVPWLAYEALCRSPLRHRQGLVALIGYVALVTLTFAFTQVFSGRGAFVQIGALVGTIMVASVLVVIIPNQKKIVDALVAGREPDPALGAAGKLRSVHNNYLTLPVVFLMISNHSPLLTSGRYNWLIVAIVLALGPVIRHFFNARHEGRKSPWWTWVATAWAAFAIYLLSVDGWRDVKAAALPAPAFAEVETVIASRCTMCHAREPVWADILVAPKGVALDTPERIRRHAALIGVNAAFSRAMPPGNITQMTDDERRVLGAWLLAHDLEK
jgi:uncharacterized membrane protein